MDQHRRRTEVGGPHVIQGQGDCDGCDENGHRFPLDLANARFPVKFFKHVFGVYINVVRVDTDTFVVTFRPGRVRL